MATDVLMATDALDKGAAEPAHEGAGLYAKLKTLQRQLEFLEIQVRSIAASPVGRPTKQRARS